MPLRLGLDDILSVVSPEVLCQKKTVKKQKNKPNKLNKFLAVNFANIVHLQEVCAATMVV